MPIKKQTKPVWLVTGGAGFIGSNISEKLLKMGYPVRIIDNFSTGSLDNINHLKGNLRVIKGNILNANDLQKALKGVSFISHQAALRSVPRSVANPKASNRVNVEGTLNLLVEAKKAGAKKLVYASSSSVYGECRKFPQKEIFKPEPVSPYAVSKLAAENYCMVWAKNFGLDAVGLRYFNVFGPRQNPNSKYAAVIPIFMDLICKNKPVEVHSNGKQSRDFTYVDNVVSANIKAVLSKASGQAYNIACNETHSILDIIRVFEKLSGKKIKINFHPKRMGDVIKTCADISKAKKDFGYKPLVGFDEGLKKTWKYFTSEIK